MRWVNAGLEFCDRDSIGREDTVAHWWAYRRTGHGASASATSGGFWFWSNVDVRISITGWLSSKCHSGKCRVEAVCCYFFGIRVLNPYLFIQREFSLSNPAILCGKLVGLCLSLCVIAGIVALKFLSFILMKLAILLKVILGLPQAISFSSYLNLLPI